MGAADGSRVDRRSAARAEAITKAPVAPSSLKAIPSQAPSSSSGLSSATSSPQAPGLAGGLDHSRLTHLVGYAASRASIELKKCFVRDIGPLQIKVGEFSILMLLAANGDVNQKQLGEALDISPPNMAVTLDRMVEQGWARRVRSTRDRRAQQIHLTDAGRELVRKADDISRTMEHEALRLLSEAERALLIELLLKVAGPARSTRER
jgi:DNA-binding MarR family transcriptional regulator